MAHSELLPFLLVAGLAAVLSAGLTWAIHPMLRRVAMAKPNARSSHRIPTPQGGGIAVQIAVPTLPFAAVIFMTLVGAADDIKSVPVLPRLLLQAAAVGAAIY